MRSVSKKAILWISLSLWLGAGGCSRAQTSDEADDASSHQEVTRAEDASSGAEAMRNAEEPEGASEPAWTMESLQNALREGGWRLDDEAPVPPSVAIPDGASVEGVTVEREALRADIFVYRYPRDGYAKAHVRAQDGLARTLVIRRNQDVIAVVGRDKEHAQAVLDALPLSLRQE